MPAKLVLALCPNQTIEERGDFALLHGLCWRCLTRFGKEGVNLRKTIFTCFVFLPSLKMLLVALCLLGF